MLSTMLIVDYIHLRASEFNVLCAEDGEMRDCWWKRWSGIGNAVCWNYKTEVVIRFAVVILSKSNQGMTEIENMIKEREILKQIHSKEQEKKEQ